jgi:hypothetical protein
LLAQQPELHFPRMIASPGERDAALRLPTRKIMRGNAGAAQDTGVERHLW